VPLTKRATRITELAEMAGPTEHIEPTFFSWRQEATELHPRGHAI